jgi:hypothetical protein
MPIEVDGAEEAAELAGEMAPGEFVYDVLGDIVRELEPDMLLSLVGAIQRGEPWSRLSPPTRGICAELDKRLFDGD